MNQIFASILLVILFSFGLYCFHKHIPKGSSIGRKPLSKLYLQKKKNKSVWEIPLIESLVSLLSKTVFLDETMERTLKKRLEKAGIQESPRLFTAKKYLILAVGGLCVGICIVTAFYMGILLVTLATAFCVLKLRDALDEKIKAKDMEIAREMPRFVRTICRQLQADRDLQRVIISYQKVAGESLGKELDILLAELQSGNGHVALAHFESRIATPEAFRLCGALGDMLQGIDQSATLNYLADAMASESKEQIRRTLSLRPGKMRATYYPAVGVCIAMVLYVLVLYVINQLNGLI